jgi:ABC-type Fe3+-hydroxamate transport system substrate-binding protein
VALVDDCGGLCFRPNPISGTDEVAWEEIMEFDPQLVLYAVEGQGRAFDPQEFLRIEGWNRTEAAVRGRIYSVDEGVLAEPRLGAPLLRALLAEQFWGGSRVEHPALRRLGDTET